jgi:hypothetical protein
MLHKNWRKNKHEYIPIFSGIAPIYNSVMTDIDDLSNRFRMSPYQIWILRQNAYKYNLNKIRKFGHCIYAPYKCNLARSFQDAVKKILFGPRADLIGTDRMLASDQRRINIKRMLFDHVSDAL